MVAKYCDEYVCLSICVFACSRISGETTRTSFKFSAHVACGRVSVPSSDGVVIRYGTSGFVDASYHVLTHWALAYGASRVFLSGKSVTAVTTVIDFNHKILLSDKDQQVRIHRGLCTCSRGELCHLRLLCYILCSGEGPHGRMSPYQTHGQEQLVCEKNQNPCITSKHTARSMVKRTWHTCVCVCVCVCECVSI